MKRFRKILILCLTLLILVTSIRFIFFNPKEVEAAWYSDTWGFRTKLTIDYTKVGADQTDFPVYVDLSQMPADFHNHVNQTDARDIRVTKSDGTTELPREVVFYTAASNTGELHFKYTGTLSSSTNTSIYIYYGNASATDYAVTDTYGRNNVWDSNYKAVWHLTESTGAHADSTTNGNNSSSITVTTQGTANAKFGGADDFDGVDDNINNASPASLDNLGPLTYSAWIYPKTGGEGGYGRIVEKTSSNLGINFYINNTDLANALTFRVDYSGTALNVVSAANSFSMNAWNLVAVTWDDSATATNVHIYVNGAEVASYDTRTNGTLNQPDDSAGNFYIGNNSATTRTFNGQIDEVDVSGSVRSSTWLSTQYNNQNSPSTFFTEGAEEKKRGSVLNFAFDEGYGTTVRDSSPNGYIGTLSGTTTPSWQPEDLCISGKCLYYNGSTAYTSVTTSIPNVQSVSFWVKPKTNGETLVDFDGGTHYLTASSGTITASGFSTPTVYVNGQSGGLLIANAWQHVEVTTATAFTATNITIGKKTSFLNGYIDEFKVYDYARTAAQVKLDYNSRNSQSGVAARFGPDIGKTLSSGLVGYWKMDESSGNAADSSGNGLTLTNNGVTTFVGGKFGNGSEHVPASSQYFSTATTISGVKTVSFWTNPDVTTNYFVSLTSGAYITASSGTISATGFTSPTIYVNGIASTTLTANIWQLVTVTTDTAIDANQFYAGRQDTNYYDGTLDEVRTYNRALSPAEVGQLYNWAPGPVGWWKLDENTGESAFDTSGNGNAGTMGSSGSPDSADPTWTTGKYGSGVKTGIDDYVNVPDNNTYSVVTTGALTVETWINIDIESGGMEIISKDGASNYEWHLARQNGGAIKAAVNGLNGTSYITNNTSTTVPLGQWAHIAFTIDTNIATPILMIYINGVLAATDTVQDGGVLGNGTLPVRFGINSSGTYPTYGSIDNVYIYNYTRTPAQIIEDMNAGHPAPGSPVGSTVGYWKFDEGYATTANDNSINANNLTLSSASWTNSGKFGKAFNGLTNVRASRTTDADLEFGATEDFTLSLWYKSDSATNPGAIEYLVNDGAAAGSAGYAIYANTSGNLCFGIDDDVTWGPDVASCTTTDVYDNTWHHIIAVRNVTSDTTKIYLDAIEKDSDTDTTTATLDSSPTFYIGDANATDGTDEFLGDIDEVKVYRLALSSEQAKVEYNRGSQTVLGALGTDSSGNPSWDADRSYCPAGDTTATCAPVGEWLLDENTGTSTTYDTSTGGRNGTLTNIESADWTPGKYGSALNLDGSNEYVDIGTGPSSVKSISFWVYPATTTEYFVNLTSTTDYIWANAGTVTATGLTSPTIYVNGIQTTTISTGSWQHIVVTTGTAENASNLDIGRTQDANYLEGRIDQVKLYDYALSASQIAWDYNYGKPVGWWKMDENTGTAANDSMGNSTTGTLTNTPTWATGKLNSAVSFAGSNQHVLIADDSDFDFADDEDMTLTTWFKHTTASAQEIILSKYAAAGYKIVMESDGDITCGLDYDATWTPTDSATSTLATYDDGNWHHIACIKTGATSLSLYIDGILIGSDSSLTATNILTNADPLYLGIDDDGATNDFTGTLDDVRIYRYPLTLQQIRTVMGEGALRFGQ